MNVYQLYFSPTGGTKKAADALAAGFGIKVTEIDCIKDTAALEEMRFAKEDLCLVAVPAYGGRVPGVMVAQLRKLHVEGTKAVLMAVYGNRHIDDTLIELYDVLKEAGFVCMAGVEAVAEHSLMRQFAAGRPDEQDRKELEGFGRKIWERFLEGGQKKEVKLPGNRPYKEYNGVPLKPGVTGKCTKCGLCARECPAGAISKEDPKEMDTKACISCMHCAAVCPQGARKLNSLLLMGAAQKLKKHCEGRKENRLYL